MGCYNFLCPSLAAPEGAKYFNAYLAVCAYNPVYFMSNNGALYSPSSGGCDRRNTCGRRDGEPQGCYSFGTGSAEMVVRDALCSKHAHTITSLCIDVEYCFMLVHSRVLVL